MTSLAFSHKKTTMAWAAAAVLVIALIGSWLWFLRAPAQAPLSQEQLGALAAQAGKSGAKPGRNADPYKDEVVKKAIREHAAAIQKPWLAYLKDKAARPAGALMLAWTIAPDGKATQIEVVRSDFDNAAFTKGMRDAVAAIVFPPPPGGQPYEVSHKLFFKQEQEGK